MCFDRCRHFLGAPEVKKTVAIVDHRQFSEWIDLRIVGPHPCDACRCCTNAARPEAGTGSVGRRRIEWHTGHDQVHAVKVARVLATHE